ncbi:MAG: S66 peptidase family protein [Lachnospiraceae bacterium]|jgi:muramoyltetrapeptide carboxypeptidase|nr:S66 peptidase family protein [Lachnospiraceae bacterium]MEE3461510.1 S66 peptidase family protein [Lachnospiraceae bacterium]
MKRPDLIKKGANIAITAPSFGCTTEPYKTCLKSAVSKFKSMGFNVTVGKNVDMDCGVGISNTPEACARELMDFYMDDSIDMVISAGGGELMCKILDFMDFEKLKNVKPKWFAGYSDNTNFIYPLTTLTDHMAIYGPCAPSFGTEWHKSHKDLFDLAEGMIDRVENYDSWEIESKKDADHPLEPYNLTEKSCLSAYDFRDISNGCQSFSRRCQSSGRESSSYASDDTDNSNISAALNELNTTGILNKQKYQPFNTSDISFTGRLAGGCLDCLELLSGTRFDGIKSFNEKYGNDGIIFFIESCDLNMMSIKRALWKLKVTGAFDKVSGFLIGRPLHFSDEDFGMDRFGAYLSELSELHVPVIMDADIGHLPPSMPIISGARAEVSYTDGSLTINYI